MVSCVSSGFGGVTDRMPMVPLVVVLLSADRDCTTVSELFFGRILIVFLGLCNRYAGVTLPDVSGFIGLKFDGRKEGGEGASLGFLGPIVTFVSK